MTAKLAYFYERRTSMRASYELDITIIGAGLDEVLGGALELRRPRRPDPVRLAAARSASGSHGHMMAIFGAPCRGGHQPTHFAFPRRQWHHDIRARDFVNVSARSVAAHRHRLACAPRRLLSTNAVKRAMKGIMLWRGSNINDILKYS